MFGEGFSWKILCGGGRCCDGRCYVVHVVWWKKYVQVVSS